MSKFSRARALSVVGLLGVLVAAACVAPTNPNDPDTPADQQARATLRVRVLDEGDNAVTVGAAVFVAALGGDPTAARDDDGDGVFVVDDLIPGAYTVTGAASGLGTAQRDVTLLAGEERDLDIVISGGGVALGNVTGSARKEAQLSVAAPDHSGVVVEAFAAGVTTGVRGVTNAEGRYDLSLLAGTYELHVSASDHEPQTRAVVVVAGGSVTAEDITLEVNPGSVDGVVVAEDLDASDGVAPSAAGATISLQNAALTTTANADGSFRLTGLPPGPQRLLIALDDHVASVVDVFVAASTTHDIGTIALARARGTITGVVNVDGAADAASVIVEADGADVVDVTGIDGAFSLRVPTGTWSVTAAKTGFRRATVSGVVVGAGAVVDVGAVALAPSVGVLVINDGAALTNDVDVTLAIDEPGAVRVRASEDPAFVVGVTDVSLPVDGRVGFALSSGDGAKTVFAQAIDAAGDVTTLTGTITLDTTAPVLDSIVVDDGDGVTNSVSVTVSVFATGADTMRISTDGTLDAELATPYAVTSLALLPSGDGTKSVCVTVSDDAGNATAPGCATVNLETLPPVAPRLLRNDRLFDGAVVSTAAGRDLRLRIAPYAASDGVVRVTGTLETPNGLGSVQSADVNVACSTAGDITLCDDDDATPGIVVALLDPDDGDDVRGHLLTLRAVDRAGNLSTETSVAIVVDNTPPLAPTPAGGDVLCADDGPPTNCPGLVFKLNHAINSDSFTLQLRENPGQIDATFSHYEATKTLTTAPTPAAFERANAVDNFIFPLTQGAPLNGVDPAENPTCQPFRCVNTLWLRAVDLAGNVGPVVRVDVDEDSTPPTRPTLTPRGGALRGTQVAVSLAAPATDRAFGDEQPVSAYEIKQGTDGAFGGVPPGQEPTGPWLLSLVANTANEVCVRGIDAAGNIGIEDCIDVVEQTFRLPVATDGSDRRVVLLGETLVALVDRALVAHSIFDDDLTDAEDAAAAAIDSDLNNAGLLRGARTFGADGVEHKDLIVDSGDRSFNNSSFRFYPDVDVDGSARNVCGRGAATDGAVVAYQLNATTLRVSTRAAVVAAPVANIAQPCTTIAGVGADIAVPSLCPGTRVAIEGAVMAWCEGTATIRRKVGALAPVTLTTAASPANLGIFGNGNDTQQPLVTSTATFWVEAGRLRRLAHTGATAEDTGIAVGSLEDAEADRVAFLQLGSNGASVDVALVETTPLGAVRLLTNDLPPQSQASLEGNRVAFVDLGGLDEDIALVDLTTTGWRVASDGDESIVAAGNGMVAYAVLSGAGLSLRTQVESSDPRAAPRVEREIEGVDFLNLDNGSFTFIGGTPLGASTLLAGGKTAFLAKDTEPNPAASQAWQLTAIDVASPLLTRVSLTNTAKQIDNDPSADATIAWGVNADGDHAVYVDVNNRLQLLRLSGANVTSTVDLGVVAGTLPFVDVEAIDAGLGVAVVQVGNNAVAIAPGDRRRRNVGTIQCVPFGTNTALRTATTVLVDGADADTLLDDPLVARAPSLARVGGALVMTYQSDAGTGGNDVRNHACTLTCPASGAATCSNDVMFGAINDGVPVVGRAGIAAYLTFVSSSAGDVAAVDILTGRHAVITGEGGDRAARDFINVNGTRVFWADNRLDSFDVWDADLAALP